MSHSQAELHVTVFANSIEKEDGTAATSERGYDKCCRGGERRAAHQAHLQEIAAKRAQGRELSAALARARAAIDAVALRAISFEDAALYARDQEVAAEDAIYFAQLQKWERLVSVLDTDKLNDTERAFLCESVYVCIIRDEKLSDKQRDWLRRLCKRHPRRAQ